MWSIISLVFALIALIAALPLLSKLVIYLLYRPKFEIHLYWSYEAKQEITDLNILNRDKRNLNINTRFVLDKPWRPKENMRHYFDDMGLVGGCPSKGRFWFKLKSHDLPGYSTLGLAFPLECKSEECTLEIIIYPKVHLSEFRLPIYFGDVDLKPVRRVFTLNQQA